MSALGARPQSVDRTPGRFTRGALLAAVVLALVAVVVRLIGITLPPLAFHGDRQLYGTLMARGFWSAMGGSVPEGTTAAVAAARSPVIEPPIVQGVASIVYLGTGEQVWLVRAVLAVLWVATAAAVFGLARRLVDLWAGWVAAAAWLLMPFGIALSRSFQPDGPMVCGLALTMWSSAKDDDEAGQRPSPSVRTVAIAGLTVLVKPTVGLIVLPILLAMPLARGGSKAVREARLWLSLVASVVPAVVYLLVGAVTGLLAGQGDQRFAPAAWLEWSTWTGWWNMLTRVVAPGAVLLAGLGLASASRRTRAVAIAVGAGYLAQCVAFAHHTATHDYYHSVLLPLVALGLGAFASAARRVLRCRTATWLAGAVPAGVIALALLAGPQPYPYVENALPEALAAMPPAAASAGEALGHSSHVLFVARGYGSVQQFYGYLAGPAWPLQGDLDTDRLFGASSRSAGDRLAALEVQYGALEWALVTEPSVMTEQPDLAALLASTFCPGPSGPGWAAYRRC